MSTELSCETHVAGGATVTLNYRFTLNSYYFVPRGAAGGTRAKALNARWNCAALACVPLGWHQFLVIPKQASSFLTQYVVMNISQVV
jgi:hypothetical protein